MGSDSASASGPAGGIAPGWTGSRAAVGPSVLAGPSGRTGSSRMCRSGERYTHKNASVCPMAPTQSVGRTPMVEPSTPPGQPAQRHGAPDHEPDRGVHPAQQPLRGQRLPEAHLGDVVDRMSIVFNGHHAPTAHSNPAALGERQPPA